MNVTTTSGPAPPDPTLAFAQKLLSLLETGSFTTSYKYALLLAILDETLEQTGLRGDVPAALRGRWLGRRVLDLYWPQARPYAELQTGAEPAPDDRRSLRQSSVKGDIVSEIEQIHQELEVKPRERLEAVRRRAPGAIGRLERLVIWRVMRNPIPRLQVFGGQKTGRLDPFIYEVAWDDTISLAQANGESHDDRLRLAPGAARHLVALAGVVRPVVEREWLRYVARRNHLPESDLEDYLFGSERRALRRLLPRLRELQEGHCFYCGDAGTSWEIDHFIPWARWPDDRLDNLVVAHRGCNNSKRAAFAAVRHLERWLERFVPGTQKDDDLTELAEELDWPRQPRRTLGAATVLYRQQPTGAMLWLRPGQVEPLDRRSVDDALGDVGSLAADPPDPYEP
jgi:5-methylcytosine-specific restriction endonuclease McrA